MASDNRVDMEIELAHDTWYQLMRLAHEQDITLNHMVQQMLTAALDQPEQIDTPKQEHKHDPA